ncbi:uncharacterized protein LOC112593867, partial [Melanaphis sacchari]|uniref:uncharacterized protein LOC112593867 n=1 Tax=Melanaphis sacchari TaxID=742174 RepID=UPI000DC13A03
TPSSVEEQEVLKETSSSNEDQEVLKEAPTSVDEQKVLKETPSSDRDQENLKETPSSDGEQILKDTQTIEGKQEVLLTESEIKVEPEDTQESEYGELNGSIIILSDDEDELPVPLSIPLSASSHAKELINCLNESRYCIPKRCSSTLAYYDGYLPVNLPDRRSVSVPREINLACEKKPKPILPVSAYIDLLSDSSDENDSDCSSENKLRPNLKRKRSLNNLLHNFEIENTRKTMKPGPKSKTRNIATVHEMITEAKLLGLGPSMESDTSDDDSDMSDEESELYIMDTIDLMSATDDEPDDGDLKPEADDDGKKDCLSDDVKENSINGENKMIDNKLSATLDDETNGNEVLEKAIDSNIIKEDENMENKELKSMEVHPNQMTEDKSCSDEIEKKNNLNDTNELLKVGE